MATEREWRAARSRFVENASGPLRPIRPADGWFLTERPEKGPLVDEFLELSHALFTSPPDAGAVGVLELVVARAQSLVPAADMVSLRELASTIATRRADL